MSISYVHPGESIIESLWLEKTSKIMKSKRQPIATMPAKNTGLSPLRSHFESGVWHRVSSSRHGSSIDTHTSRAAGNFTHRLCSVAQTRRALSEARPPTADPSGTHGRYSTEQWVHEIIFKREAGVKHTFLSYLQSHL